MNPETHTHKWWISEVPSVLPLVFRCNCGATLTGYVTITEELNLKEARVASLRTRLEAAERGWPEVLALCEPLRPDETGIGRLLGIRAWALAALPEDEPERLLPWDEYVKKVRAAKKDAP